MAELLIVGLGPGDAACMTGEALAALEKAADFSVERCADRLLEDSNHGTTWFVVAQKPRQY